MRRRWLSRLQSYTAQASSCYALHFREKPCSVHRRASNATLDKALNDTLNCDRIFLQHSFAFVIDDCVGLDKDFAGLLFGEDERAQVVDPVGGRLSQLFVESCESK